ncbi:AAEL011401-PA [Aedes aegypti]|uniref:AAEL011401-PA n=1 Tax=Aedes aegypti TaxID=7159 RepID=Q16Q46_AEDAE|nr:AAEL011401-PA [Aedes aegypti]
MSSTSRNRTPAVLASDVSSQILPKVTVEDISARPQSKIGRLRAIGNQIRFLRRLERSIRQKDRLIAVSDEDAGSSPRDSPRVTSPLLKKPDSSGLQTNSTSAVGGRIVVVEAQQHPQPQQQQLLMPSSAMGIKSRQNFKMSRQKRVAGSRGGYNDQSWQERDRKMIDGADVNSD